MTKLFHAAPLKLAPGSVVLPGNWARIIRAIGERHDRWHQEGVLEQLRAARYAHLPSRLDACFACVNEEALRFFVRHGNKDNPCPPVLYEVQKVEPEANEHRTDFNLISANKPGEPSRRTLNIIGAATSGMRSPRHRECAARRS